MSPQSLSSTPSINHPLATPWTTPIDPFVSSSAMTNKPPADLDSYDFDALLANPMYDEVHDVSGWEPLFSPPSVSPLELPLGTRFVREKRSAIVMGPNKYSSAFPNKRQKALACEFDRLAGPSLSSAATLGCDKTDLPPIVVSDPSDPKALRRARNTAAARRSRDKKREHLQELEARITELERTNAELLIENQFLKGLPKQS